MPILEPPKIAPLTDEKLAEIAQEQNKWRKLTRVLKPRERFYARAIDLEMNHRQTQYNDGLAEALAMQGRFDEAVSIAKREDLLAEYAEYRDAKSERCDCAETDEHGNLTTFIEKEVFDGKNVRTYIRCTQCRGLSLREPDTPLRRQREQEEQAAKRGHGAIGGVV